ADHVVMDAQGVKPGQWRTFELVMDRRLRAVKISVDELKLIYSVSSVVDGEEPRLGQELAMSVDPRGVGASVCRDLLGR
ncbi:MAG: hypothetical protein M3R01_13145, partial [Actinomycetota bacterium]|nr:hypothetical protein [Actinomycetota bacterium]